jgi:uncharacterized membrane protein
MAALPRHGVHNRRAGVLSGKHFLNKLTGKYSEPDHGVAHYRGSLRRNVMRTLLTTLAASLLAISFATTADAATKKKQTSTEASCKAQAAKKYSAVHFMKRRDYVKQCMGAAKA